MRNSINRKVAATAVVSALLLMVGCEESTLVYEGVERPESEVSEIIADKLEVENPGLDIYVEIGQEVD